MRAANKHVPPATIDKLVMNFICKGLQPLAIIALTYIKLHLEMTEHESEDQQREFSDEEDFFSRPIYRRMQSPVELDGYLACATDTMKLLHSFSAIKKLSLKLNTALPAFAACE